MTANFNAAKDCCTSISSLSYAANVKMLIITLHPDLIYTVLVPLMLVMHITMYSFMSVLVWRLFSMIASKGFKKSFWKLNFLNSSFSRNLSANYRNESIAKIETIRLGWEPTSIKWALSICQILLHTKRMRAILRSATSTKHWRLNFLGLRESESSFLDTRHRFSIKQMIAS